MKGLILLKIERIAENKIRIIVNLDDLAAKNIDMHALMSNSIESQSLFVDMLDEAEKEVGFSTKNCKIYVESLASTQGDFIFTITKYSSDTAKKRVKIKRKTANIDFEKAIYKFDNFEEVCSFCTYIKNSKFENLNGLAKSTSLYTYQDAYFLVITDINLDYTHLKGFYALITEFAKSVNHAENFESKLLEYGKPIMKRDAIKRCIKLFA